MIELNNATPISLIVNDELEWKISYEIHPIQLHHATRIAEMISKDVLFEYVDVNVLATWSESQESYSKRTGIG